ncbi:c-type cytochrome [Oleiagrimonas soli]|uniref:Cytochrome C n=1 Tax=Oleiagrimonas soli TaxID=1543381 RepID=A0A099CYD9_9GAMM|nr:c-type cytochrome [Oleiagrimonas soli]KGI78789.1 cytochrome C [Oleiagrimonas soli]MBB6184441.1 cytochrome c553 [Oleiagrimonas soli]
MSFRRVVALAATLVAGAAMAQSAPQQAAPAAAGSTAPTTAAATSQPSGPLPGDAKTGQAKAAVCGACHGMDGNSSDAQYPKLAGQNEEYISRQLHNFKSGKRQNPIMLGFASQLSDQDMADVGAYFMTKRSRPGVADEKLAEEGGKLYREGDASRAIPACMACHGPDGRGNPGAVYPQLAGQHAQYLQKTLTAWHDGTVWGDDDHSKIMPAIAQRLTAKDITALSSYLEGLHTATDTQAESAAP